MSRAMPGLLRAARLQPRAIGGGAIMEQISRRRKPGGGLVLISAAAAFIRFVRRTKACPGLVRPQKIQLRRRRGSVVDQSGARFALRVFEPRFTAEGVFLFRVNPAPSSAIADARGRPAIRMRARARAPPFPLLPASIAPSPRPFRRPAISSRSRQGKSS
jgi:hypothetical protein